MEKFFIKTEIDLPATLFCGQTFRWTDGGNGSFSGVAGSRSAIITQEADGIVISGIGKEDLSFWENYFDSECDYKALRKAYSDNATLKAACSFAPGIRVLRQEPFETLISFIISQNNNIKRITGIIDRLCRLCGEQIGKDAYAFPSPQTLAALSPDDLSPVRAGFRARYITDAARKVSDKEVRLDEINGMLYNDGKRELMKIIGVGEKVADCVLLYGFHKTEAFPRDVWIKRVVAEYFPGGLPACIKGTEGIAQQFLFHYIRNLKG